MSSLSYKRRIFFSVYALTVIDTIIAFLLYSFLPDFLLNVPGNKQVWLSILFAIFIGCQMIAGPLLGYIGDQYGRRPVFILATVATFFAQLYLIPRSLAGILMNRFSDGLTNGIYATTRSAITDISTHEQAPKRLGVIEAVSSLGIILGPAVASLLLFLLLPRGLETTTIIIGASIGLALLNVVIALTIPETNTEKKKHFSFKELAESIVKQIHPILLFKRIRAMSSDYPELGKLLLGVFCIGGALGYYSYFIVFLSQGALKLSTSQINQLMLGLGIVIFLINAIFFKFVYSKINTWKYFQFALVIGIVLIPAYGIFGNSVQAIMTLFLIDSITFGLALSLLNGFISQKAPDNQKGEAFGIVQGAMALSGFLTVIVYTVLTAIDITLPFYWFSFCLACAYWVIFIQKPKKG